MALVVISGLPCTGKSELARGIAPTLAAPVYSVDPVESAILRANVPRSFETGLAAYLVVEALADTQLSLGGTAIVDAVSSVAWAKTTWRDLAARHGVPLRVIECRCSDDALHRERLAARRRDIAFPEPTWSDIERIRLEYVPWDEPILVVDAGEPLDANLRRAIAWLG